MTHDPSVGPIRRRLRTGIGRAWVVVWLVFLVQPIATHVGNGGRDTAGALVLVLGAAVYLVCVVRIMGDLWAGQPRTFESASFAGAAGGVTAVCMIVAAVLIGEDGFTLLPYATVLFALGMGLRVGLTIGVSLCAASFALSHALTGHTMELGLLFASVASGVASGLGAYSSERTRDAEAAREDAALLRVQEERNRMARDLHDILGHSLTVITMKAELAGKLVDADPEKAKQQIVELEQLSRSALADVRTTVSGYREMSLAGEIARARRAFTDAGMEAELPGSIDEVSPDLRDLFAWAVREATTNVIRHSGASHVTMTLSPTRLTIADDGRGALTTTSDGTGLAGLRERAAAVGAVVHTRSEDGFALVVEAAAPGLDVPGSTTPDGANAAAQTHRTSLIPNPLRRA